jgi:hypothetical protein
MNSTKKQNNRFPKLKIERFDPPSIPGKLIRTHKIIRADRDREIQFLILCSKIRLDDFKQERSNQQRDERREKRLNSQAIHDIDE